MVNVTEDILNYMRVKNSNEENKDWDVYQIGCQSVPLNFASQQLRAFKLTWALDTEGLIKDKKIAVIGGGLAGLTAGIVCLIKDAKDVTLYERSHELMALQHGTLHRYVHPMIFRWPKDEAKDETDFPILNWEAGNADTIRKKILFEIDTLLNDCSFHRNEKNFYIHRLGSDVRQLLSIGNKIELTAEAQESIQVDSRKKELHVLEGGGEYLPVGIARNYQNKYDVVIVAVGYGLERKKPEVPFHSYWQLDTFAQPTIRDTLPRRWLVSGIGDGGLIDVIRLILYDIDQENLTTILLSENIFGDKGEIILKIDTFTKNWISDERLFNNEWESQFKDFKHTLLEKDNSLQNNLLNSRYIIDENEISLKIQQNFDELLFKYNKVSQTLKKFLQRFRRTDTVVYLNGTTELPYELGASLFNRFLIYLLRRDCSLRYRCGRLDIVSSKSDSYQVTFKKEHPDISDEILEVDDIVIRHGADSALGRLFGQEAYDHAKEKSTSNNFEKELWDKNDDFESWKEALKNKANKMKTSK
jgi:hypothetical protein